MGNLLDDTQKKALATWYAQDWILDKVRELRQANRWEELEEFVHRDALMPLGKHDKLPDYMRNDEGKTLFPDNLNPIANLEGWQDAIEVGWAVMNDKLGLSQDEVHIRIRDIQNADWDDFLNR